MPRISKIASCPEAGLREPLTALKRANVVVLEENVPYPARRLGRKTIWRVRRGIRLPLFRRALRRFAA